MCRREQKEPGLARVSESSWRLLGICINFLLSAGETTVAGGKHVGGEECVHVSTHPFASPSIAPPPQLPHLSTFSPLTLPLEFAVRKKKVISPPMWLLVLDSFSPYLLTPSLPLYMVLAQRQFQRAHLVFCSIFSMLSTDLIFSAQLHRGLLSIFLDYHL